MPFKEVGVTRILAIGGQMRGVIVVGGSGGIGQAICHALAREGYGIAVFDPAPCPDLFHDLRAA
ncbi:MAG: hypothetical protein DMG06_18385 [Acidobacteria bacterium]|nr:MAG: hypothetical protein DMG06_18385 [Acidobacteriota bacterium]